MEVCRNDHKQELSDLELFKNIVGFQGRVRSYQTEFFFVTVLDLCHRVAAKLHVTIEYFRCG